MCRPHTEPTLTWLMISCSLLKSKDGTWVDGALPPAADKEGSGGTTHSLHREYRGEGEGLKTPGRCIIPAPWAHSLPCPQLHHCRLQGTELVIIEELAGTQMPRGTVHIGQTNLDDTKTFKDWTQQIRLQAKAIGKNHPPQPFRPPTTHLSLSLDDGDGHGHNHG